MHDCVLLQTVWSLPCVHCDSGHPFVVCTSVTSLATAFRTSRFLKTISSEFSKAIRRKKLRKKLRIILDIPSKNYEFRSWWNRKKKVCSHPRRIKILHGLITWLETLHGTPLSPEHFQQRPGTIPHRLEYEWPNGPQSRNLENHLKMTIFILRM